MEEGGGGDLDQFTNDFYSQRKYVTQFTYLSQYILVSKGRILQKDKVIILNTRDFIKIQRLLFANLKFSDIFCELQKKTLVVLQKQTNNNKKEREREDMSYQVYDDSYFILYTYLKRQNVRLSNKISLTAAFLFFNEDLCSF